MRPEEKSLTFLFLSFLLTGRELHFVKRDTCSVTPTKRAVLQNDRRLMRAVCS